MKPKLTRATKKDLERFLDQVEALQTVHFPLVCRELGIHHGDIKAAIARKGWFYERLDEILEDMKFAYLETLNRLARGECGIRNKPTPAAIHAMVALIDSGTLLGESRTPEPEEDPEEEILEDEDSIKARLGL